MSDYSWFRLLIRAVGVLLLGLSLPLFLWTLGNLIAEIAQNARAGYGSSAASLFLSHLPAMSGYGIQAAFGLYLLFGGASLVEFCLKGVRGRCARCGYNLQGLADPVCHECGTPNARPPRQAGS
jgi:hypothetical protein